MKYSLLLLLLFLAACSTALVFASKEEELYYEKCGGCHRVYKKSEFSKEHWQKEVEDMSKRAKLTSEQKKMILNYLFEESTVQQIK